MITLRCLTPAFSLAVAIASAETVLAQDGMLYAGTPNGSGLSVDVQINLGGSWSTLFTTDFGCSVCQGEMPSMAVDEISRRVYWTQFDDLVYWDVDSGNDTILHVDMGTGQMVGLAFNPDTGLLYGIEHDDDVVWIDPADGSNGVLFTLDDPRFKTLDYNRADDTFYAYQAGTGAADGLYRIDILGDHSVTRVTDDPWGGFVANAATVHDDDVFVVRSPGSPFPSMKGLLSTGGPPWSDFETMPNQANENSATAFAYWLFPPCTGDLDGSGDIAFGDIVAVLSAWGPCGECPEDLDGSGAVDFGDLLFLLGAWGACPS